MSAQSRSFVTRLLVAAVLSFAAAGMANAATIQLRASLNGAQEVPPVATTATGLARVTYDTVSGQLSWNVAYSGLSSSINAAHFHGPTPAGFAANITVPISPGSSPIVGSVNINATQAAQLLSGQWYINLHSNNFPNGEIRGQVLVVRGDLDGDGQSDVVWRNVSTGDNYLYPMNGTAILASEGYLRQVPDQKWQIAGIGDFNGDGKADILWRNSFTGENYIYLMNGKDIAGEGYIRTVADQSWQVAGVGDFDGDGKADILWRNSTTGENYIYPMDGTAILATEGYLRQVADKNWQIVGIGDFNGDGKADILWRNSSSGENYIYLMNGTSIAAEGYLRTVADPNWHVMGVADFDGDGRSDILWRNISTGENYIYPMASLTILPTEGYIRTVADQNWRVATLGDCDGDGNADIFWRNASTGQNYIYPMRGTQILAGEGYVRTVADTNWRVAGARPAISGLDFPSNSMPSIDVGDNTKSTRFRFTGAALVPVYGTSGNGVTYLWKLKPRQQAGYYTTFFWANDDGNGNFNTFAWNAGVGDTYYGAHPYPDSGTPSGPDHHWEIPVQGNDVIDPNGVVVKGVWYSQAFRAWGANGAAKNHEFYWNLPDTTSNIVRFTSTTGYANTNPPFPALTFGDAPWNPNHERLSGIIRGLQIYNTLLTLSQINTLKDCETDACVLSTASSLGVAGSLWYLNMNPQNASDISDKSGAGHHPAWFNSNRPTYWVQ